MVNVTALKKRLEYLGMTQSDLAEKTGLHPTTLYHIMRGARPRKSTMVLIASVLNEPVEEYWSDDIPS